MELLALLIGAVAGAAGMSAWSRRGTAPSDATQRTPDDGTAPGDETGPAAADAPAGASGDDPGDGTGSQPTPDASPEDRLHDLRRRIEACDDQIQRPADLRRQDGFDEAVALLAGPAFTPAQLLDFLTGQGYVLPSMAAAALPLRGDADAHAVVATVPRLGAYSLHFVLAWLQTLPDAASLPQLAVAAREWWWDYGGMREDIRRHLAWAASVPQGDAAAPTVPPDAELHQLEEAKATLERFQSPLLQPALDAVAAALARRREQQVLGGIGRLGHLAPTAPVFEYPALREAVDELQALVSAAPPRPQLLVGEAGVGKSTLLDLLCARLEAEGWLLFTASAGDVLAGQKYIGELEGRLREMLAVLHRPRALWRVPDFFDLLHKGSHSNDPRGILDLVLPAIERGELLLVGELTPQQHARLLLARPAIARLFDARSLPAAGAGALADVAAQWARAAAGRCGREAIEPATLAEALRIAAQYFPEQHEPGRSLRLLDEALALARQDDPPTLPIDGNTLLQAVGQRSGMPMDVLDQRQRLPLDRLREVFRRRVVGQDEAIECLVDRIAMLKAGLTDSRRPVGVFLFAGPTGTGKTELAKALGELLFGSDERLLRLDMSEFQAPDAAHRLIAGGGEGGARSLVSRIRQQPFSVLLLDEFEKAHPNVWDLFLQVFDDGRLSDEHGNTADFRHSIIILTSNVGSTLSRSAGPGFTASAGGYSRGAVEKALATTFRPEFINRLDRVVLFRPLDRTAMRGILHKELARALERRGLRNRDWAVEWEPSAIEFLLDRGFTPDLGARPLRRAIEDHLLAPLARSIVEHRAPEGDQFLFVRGAGDRLEVEFIDPDAPAGAPAPAAAGGDLRALADVAQDAPVPASALAPHVEALSARLDDAAWATAREADFAAMDDAGFWSDRGRFAVLDRIERRDRIESAIAGAGRMLERLHAGADRTLSARLAQLLFLLDIAIDDLAQGRPQDAALSLTASEGELARHPGEARQWWQRLLSMYLQWGERRGMQVEVLEQDAQRCRARLAVSGFGALHLLSGEAGLHVLESDDGRGGTRRLAVQVTVDPVAPGLADSGLADSGPSEPGPASRDAAGPGDAAAPVCRRYRDSPAPLVRDARRGWRSGRIERVLGGHFDLMSPPSSDALQ